LHDLQSRVSALALAGGKKDDALLRMKSAAEMEDGTEKSAVTPGPLAPARESLGEMLLEMKASMGHRTLRSSAEGAIRVKDILARC
jgi:hypothetical protein